MELSLLSSSLLLLKPTPADAEGSLDPEADPEDPEVFEGLKPVCVCAVEQKIRSVGVSHQHTAMRKGRKGWWEWEERGKKGKEV